MLNERNDSTKGVVHLMVTPLCDRKCKYCCNNQYNINDIPFATIEELSEAHTYCLTGGEPFQYAQPCEIAKKLKKDFGDKKVIVYTNAYELQQYLKNNDIYSIDGLTISIKSEKDYHSFLEIVKNENVNNLDSVYVYAFGQYYDKIKYKNVFKREWQPEFKPANDSIFRRLKNRKD